jgi:hypothetical protein
MEWVALVLFLLIVLSWIILPDAKKITTGAEFTSLGDDAKKETKAAARN